MQPKETSPRRSPDPRLGRVRELLQHLETDLEAGDEEKANKILDELTKQREPGLFFELGKLTRELHDAINALRCDASLIGLANVDIPDAKDRLTHVITMTEQAATRTLELVEDSKPLCNEIGSRAGEMGEAFDRFRRRELSAEESQELHQRLCDLFPWIQSGIAQVSSNLSEVLMAQSFQDLTGQIIRRVLALVEEVERNLVDLVRASGQKFVPSGEREDAHHEDRGGPQIPTRRDHDAVSGQDEVDDLLSSLGF
jgi:chemotaxis protein CheZ